MAPATRCIDWSDWLYDFFACRIASLQRAALPTDWDGAGRAVVLSAPSENFASQMLSCAAPVLLSKRGMSDAFARAVRGLLDNATKHIENGT
jgi:hypothetical protein